MPACPETNTLIRQISELSHELETAKMNLDTVQEELEEEKIHHTSLECTLELLGQQKEYLEKALRSLTEEHEQLTSVFEAERNRVVTAEQEISTLMQQKEHLEKALRSVPGEHEQLKSAFEAERNRVVTIEQELNALMQQKEHLEKALLSVTGEHEQTQISLRGREKPGCICRAGNQYAHAAKRVSGKVTPLGNRRT